MDYQAALDYILSFADLERWPGFAYSSRFDLRRMEELVKRLGQPHLKARTIHIAGSKGKGSTAAMIASALCASGHKTGLYTSPHLHTLRERISIDGQPISEQGLIALVTELKPDIEVVNRNGAYGELSTFEILTALAFSHFQRSRVEFQVLEAGLGGRLDATNVVQPEVCAITSISLDHTAILGDSIAQIAKEKAGIIKPGTVVVSSPQRAEAAKVIQETCLEKGVELIMVGEDVTWQKGNANLCGQSLNVRGKRACYELTIPLLGDHQLENAATAVACLETLAIPEKDIVSGLARVHWPGRLEILSHSPLLVVDSAHNADSARRLSQALEQLFHCERSILIIGTSSDKDISGIIAQLAPAFDTVIVTRSQHPRAAEPSTLAGEFMRYGVRAVVTGNVAEAIAEALKTAQQKDLICAAGSLFLAAEVREWAKGISGERYP
jgi:dihydrofolate synthase/folylpolyglutamate synthase